MSLAMQIYPKKENIFNAFKVTPINNIKVVIVGQDPYHQPNQAHGLCFSVLKPVPPPPSLKNIYKNLLANKEVSFKAPSHGDLTKWAQQGVFLLNATLTVEDSQPNSHAKCGWQKFTDHVISVINEQCTNVVFLLWGKPAQEKAKSVNPSKHCILKTSHPSPLSASQGFLTSSNNSYIKPAFLIAINISRKLAVRL
jgi:uracil-DNA glycosylase